MVFEQKFAFWLVVFWCTCGNFTLIFTVLFDFLDRILCLNDFPNPFIVHSRPSFLFEPNFHFSLVIFCSHVVFSH